MSKTSPNIICKDSCRISINDSLYSFRPRIYRSRAKPAIIKTTPITIHVVPGLACPLPQRLFNCASILLFCLMPTTVLTTPATNIRIANIIDMSTPFPKIKMNYVFFLVSFCDIPFSIIPYALNGCPLAYLPINVNININGGMAFIDFICS